MKGRNWVHKLGFRVEFGLFWQLQRNHLHRRKLHCDNSRRFPGLSTCLGGKAVVDNLLNSDDVHYMLGALMTFGLRVEDDTSSKKAKVEICVGQFPVGKE